MRASGEILLVAGVDEAGRGPLAGPVTAAAVILGPEALPGLADSKVLAPARRERLAQRIRAEALAWAVAEASVAEIDRLNILGATLLAMQRAVASLGRPPGQVLVDGDRCPRFACPAEAVIGGDASVAAISAASILAKQARDAVMIALDEAYPGYGFARHKGYGTVEHLNRLRCLGPSPVHRRSFAPVRALLEPPAVVPAENLDAQS